MNQKIRLIAFDLFGVIFTEGHLVSNVLMKLLPAGMDQSRVKSAYEYFNTAQINEQQFWQLLDVSNAEKIRHTFLQSFKVDTDLLAVIDSLQTTYRFAIVSNLPPDWADELTSIHRLEKNFSPLVFSGHVRLKKPQPEIYQILMSQTSIKAEQILFIDDKLENLQAAYQLGIKTVYFQKDIESLKFTADYQIKRLREIPELNIFN